VKRHETDELSAVDAVLPIRSRDAAKTRLALALDPEERDVLFLGMFASTVRVLAGWPSCRRIHIVTSDNSVPDVVTRGLGSVSVVPDPGTGLNDALRAGRDAAVAAGATAVLMLPADLPMLNVTSLERLLDAADATLAAGSGGPIVVIAPADARTGTNALLLAPPNVIDPFFGLESFAAHLRAAAGAQASVQVVDDALLGFDLDTPDDLERLDLARRLELEQLGGEIEDELLFAQAG
jgi:2-phospho-L-lactate guanylyltransferase